MKDNPQNRLDFEGAVPLESFTQALCFNLAPIGTIEFTCIVTIVKSFFYSKPPEYVEDFFIPSLKHA